MNVFSLLPVEKVERAPHLESGGPDFSSVKIQMSQIVIVFVVDLNFHCSVGLTLPFS